MRSRFFRVIVVSTMFPTAPSFLLSCPLIRATGCMVIFLLKARKLQGGNFQLSFAFALKERPSCMFFLAIPSAPPALSQPRLSKTHSLHCFLHNLFVRVLDILSRGFAQTPVFTPFLAASALLADHHNKENHELGKSCKGHQEKNSMKTNKPFRLKPMFS